MQDTLLSLDFTLVNKADKEFLKHILVSKNKLDWGGG